MKITNDNMKDLYYELTDVEINNVLLDWSIDDENKELLKKELERRQKRLKLYGLKAQNQKKGFSFKSPLGIFITIVVVLTVLTATKPYERTDLTHWYWASIKSETVIFESYLNKWPNGKNVEAARLRLETMVWEKANDKKSAFDKQVNPSNRSYQYTFLKAVEAYDNYLQKWHQGTHAKKAHQILESLYWTNITHHETAVTQSEKQAFKINQSNLKTLNAYSLYLSRYPDGQYADKIRLALSDAQKTAKQTIIDVVHDGNYSKDLTLYGDIATDLLIEETVNKEHGIPCQNLAKALGALNSPRAVETLITLAEETKPKKSKKIRPGRMSLGRCANAAVKALGQIADKAALDFLFVILDEGYVGQASKALVQIKDDRAIVPLIHALDKSYNSIVSKALNTFGHKAKEEAIKALSYGDDIVRYNTLLYLKNNYKISEIEYALLPLLKDPVAKTREWSYFALRVSKNRAIYHSFVLLLDDPDDDLAYSVARFLFAKQVTVTFPDIKDALLKKFNANKSPFKRKVEIAVILGQLGDSEATKFLLSNLKNGVGDTTIIIAKALGNIGDPRAKEPLQSVLNKWHSRKEVSTALKKLGWQPTTEEEQVYFAVATQNKVYLKKHKEIINKVLLTDVSSKEYSDIENALYSFIAMGDPSIIPTLLTKLEKKGDKNMAVAYMNCGHDSLKQAGIDWATKRGYKIVYHGGSSPVSWGEL